MSRAKNISAPKNALSSFVVQTGMLHSQGKDENKENPWRNKAKNIMAPLLHQKCFCWGVYT